MKPGDQVRCVNADFSAPCFRGYTALPTQGGVYIVRDVRGSHQRKSQPVVLLEGLVNPAQLIRIPITMRVEPGFGAWRFRKATDISELKEMLTAAPTKEKVDG